jgi:cytochrome c-type biogenesis protein CcsB
MTRYAIEIALHWTAVGLYILAAVAVTFSAVFGKPRAQRLGLALAALGLVPHGAALAVRWIAVGHGPYMLKYEVLSSNAWVAIAVLVIVLLRRPAWGVLAVVVIPVAILSVALGLFSNPESRELPPTLRSIWLVFHIVFAKISAASFILSMASAVLLLLRQRQKVPAWIEARTPPSAVLDAIIIRTAGFGFIFWTITIAAGGIWGNQAWGRYWGWDPIETWALVSWLVYGSFLHTRLFYKTGPRVTAWLSIASFALFVLVLVVLPFFITSLHASYFS